MADIPDYVLRMKGELYSLNERIEKLDAFKWSDVFKELPERDQLLLRQQRAHMNAYRECLASRYGLAMMNL